MGSLRKKTGMKLYRLSYNQPTIEGGRIVQGKTWYVAQRPGDGGSDWGYTDDPAKAGLFSEFWVKRFRRLHGTRVVAMEVP